MKLKDILEAVREEKIPLEMCEKYRDQLIHLKTQILLAEADLKKKRAKFLIEHPEKTAVQRKMEFDASPDGQRLMELQADLRALPAEIDSLQSRIYSHLRLQG